MAMAVIFLGIAMGLPMPGQSDYPPAPGSGGAECTINAQCGIPAANCASLREQCASLTGECDHGKCVCKTNQFGCSNCAAHSTTVRDPSDPNNYVYTTDVHLLDGSHRVIDQCRYAHGGKVCQSDLDCGGIGGLCLANTCVCDDYWLCDDCSITQNDMLFGLQCGVAKNGGGGCSSNADCGQGTCLKTGGRNFCQCKAQWACEHCSATIQDLVAGRTTCPETPPPAGFGVQ